MTTTTMVTIGRSFAKRVRPAKDARDLATIMLDHFEARARGASGERFVCLDDDAPEWCRVIARTAHGDMLPDDFRYDTIRNVLGCLCDRDVDEWEDDRHEIVDGCVDVYTHDLTAWLASSLDRVGYLDDVVDEGPSDSASALMRAQYAEIDEVFGLLVDALREQADEMTDGAL